MITGHSPHGHHPHRGLKQIAKIIRQAAIRSRKTDGQRDFPGLGDRRSQDSQHGMGDVHFHEVGAADAIVDIVCAAVGAEALRSTTVYVRR